MKIKSILILAFLILLQVLPAQTRSIHGTVLSEDLEPLPGLEIRDVNNMVLGQTDWDGNFQINIHKKTDSLFFDYLGMEKLDIRINKECDLLEILMMYDALYHNMSFSRMDRLRKKRYSNLNDIRIEAKQKNLFTSDEICYETAFIPIKPELEIIQKELKQESKVNFNQYKNLEVGDIVKIPLGLDSSGIKENLRYSTCVSCTEDDYEYVIECQILDKRRKHLTLELKILEMPQYDSFENDGKTLKVGDNFKYEMKYFAVIIE